MAYMLMLLAGLIRAPGGQVRADARQPLGSAVQKMRPQEDVGTGSTSLKSDPMGTLADLVPSAPRTTRVDPGDLPPPVRVEQGAKAHLQLFAGLDARRFRYRPGTWNPVHVRIHNFSSEVLQGNLLVGTTGETMVDYDLDETKTTVQTVVEVPARQSKDFFLLINPEKGNGNLVAVLKDRERNQHMASPAFTGGGAALESGETRHIVVLQSDIVDQLIDQTSTERFQYLPRLLSQSSGRIRMSDVLVSHPLPRSLPRSWRGWSGADTIILSDPDVLDLIDDDQVGALESHVLTGGSLIVELASPADARALRAAVNRNPRARWILPPTVDFPADGALLQAPRNSLRTSSDSEKILQFLQEEHPGILAIRVKPTSPSIGEGTTRIESAPAAGDDVVVGEIPIRVVAPYGWGQRILFPLAIRDVPQKKDFPAGFGSFLIPTRNQESPINGPQSDARRLKLLGDLEGFEAATIPEAWKILLFLALYAFALGPVNLFLQIRTGRPLAVWKIGVPLMVLGFSSLANETISVTRSEDTILRGFDVVTHGPDTGGFYEGYYTLYSPRLQDYAITAGTNPTLTFERLSRQEHRGLGRAPFHYHQGDPFLSADGFRLYARSTEHLRFVGLASPELRIHAELSNKLDQTPRLITITNRTQSSVDGTLLSLDRGSSVYSVGPLSPNESREVQIVRSDSTTVRAFEARHVDPDSQNAKPFHTLIEQALQSANDVVVGVSRRQPAPMPFSIGRESEADSEDLTRDAHRIMLIVDRISLESGEVSK